MRTGWWPHTLAQGRATITIVHRLSTVRGTGQIAGLDHGHVIEAGDHASLTASPGCLTVAQNPNTQ